ncbi:putative mitochondrial protein, partial [Mucuna pruriens]
MGARGRLWSCKDSKHIILLSSNSKAQMVKIWGPFLFFTGVFYRLACVRVPSTLSTCSRNNGPGSIALHLMTGSPTIETLITERILQYLKESRGKGLLFRKEGILSMEIYTDADYAGLVVDIRSTSRYCMFLGGNLVTWRSKKQNVVARSSVEAEFRAMAQDICEGL